MTRACSYSLEDPLPRLETQYVPIIVGEKSNCGRSTPPNVVNWPAESRGIVRRHTFV